MEESAINAFNQTTLDETEDKISKNDLSMKLLNLPSPIQEEPPPIPKSRPASAKVKKSAIPSKLDNPKTETVRPEPQKPVSNISKAIAKRRKGRRTYDEKPLFDAEMLCFMHEMRERGQL